MRRRTPLRLMLLSGLWLMLAGPARADVKPHALFADGVVLQQGMKVPVWGTADDGEKVTVRFLGQEVTTETTNGRWRTDLMPLKAGGPHEMTIEGKNKVQLKNVLVGEVWVCSGQSNMEWSLRNSANAAAAMEASGNPMIHLFTVKHATPAEPVRDLEGRWQECGPGTVGNFSAVAYFFGRDLQKTLGVPVGLIQTAWGGTRAEAWMSRATLESLPETMDEFTQLAKAVADHPKALEKYNTQLEEHKKAVARATEEGKTPPPAPRKPGDPRQNANAPSALYNGMVAPLIPYAIKGVIWYQGESNANKAGQYEKVFSAMIRNWRQDWGQGDFVFLFVQLAPFMKIDKQPTDTAWARLREAQLHTSLRVPHTGMAVITDVGEEQDIHPRKKEPVGHRLALAALSIAYGRKDAYPNPVYDSMKPEGNKAILHFKHVGGGLVSHGDKVEGFTVAGEDGVFVNADARIEGDDVVVWSDQVAKPVAVRYGWANYPLGNLWNKNDLPVSPFRTDDWPVGGPAKKSGR